MECKKTIHPVWVILLLVLLPPLGLVLLGERQNVKRFFKYCIGFCYGILLLILLLNYQIIPRSSLNNDVSQQTEQVLYRMIRTEYPLELLNGAQETIVKPETEKWIQVFLEVTNVGHNKIYYISLIDNPVILTGDDSISPDLSLSFEPFGEIFPNETKTGYLVFRLPLEKQGFTFQIASYSAILP